MNKRMVKTLISTSMGALMVSLPRYGSIELTYSNEDDIPEAHKELYTQKDGAWILTGVNGGGKENIDRLSNSLKAERTDHKATKEKYSKLNGLDIDELLTRNSEYDELKLRSEKVDDTKLDEIVNVRVKQKLAPIERERDELKTKVQTYEVKVSELTGKERSRLIRDEIRKAAGKLKVVDTAVEDVEMFGERLFEIDDAGRIVAKDSVGVTPGIDPAMWLGDMREKRPHWFPGNIGGGSGGNGGSGDAGENPWSGSGWNLTKQGKILRENPEKAKRMASMHGVDLKNPKRPTKK